MFCSSATREAGTSLCGCGPRTCWQDWGLAFTSAVGTPFEPRNVTRQFKALLTAAGLPNIRLHDLRHPCATLLLAQGVNPRVVMETLGHSQVSLTLNTYSHVLPALQRDAATRMNAIFAESLSVSVSVSVPIARIRPVIDPRC